MSGNKQGGTRAAHRNITLYGSDFYRKIGSLGGKKTYETGKLTHGFQTNRQLASIAGRLGGSMSKRTKAGNYQITPKEKALYRREYEQNYKRLMSIQKAAGAIKVGRAEELNLVTSEVSV